MALEPRRHRHPDPAFSIELPAEVELIDVPGMLMTARRPAQESSSPFRSNLTVVAEPLAEGADPDPPAGESPAAEAWTFPQWRLIDREAVRVDGAPAQRTLGTYRVARESGVDFGRTLSVTVEQWRVLAGGHAWIVSASCETPEYGLVGEAWSDSAMSLRVGDA